MDNDNFKLWNKNSFLGIGSFFLLTGALYMGAKKRRAKIKIIEEYLWD
jgi:hypothetical protein